MNTLYESILSSTGSGVASLGVWKDIIDLIAEKLQQLIKSEKIRFSCEDYLTDGNPGYKFETIGLSTKFTDIERVIFSKKVKDKIRFADRSILFNDEHSITYRYFCVWTGDDINHRSGLEVFYDHSADFIQVFMFDVKNVYISDNIKNYFISKMKQFEK